MNGNYNALMLALRYVYVLALVVWLGGIIVNLLLQAKFYDIALRDFGLFLAAVAFTRLAFEFEGAWSRRPTRNMGAAHAPR